MKKKVTSLLLIMGIFLGMITTGMPVVADKPMVYGAEMEEGDEIEGSYKVQLDGVTYLVCPLEGYVEVSNCGEDRSQINIADEVDGYPVTHIGAQSFWYRRQFSSIVVPESVKVIESSAFNNSIGLKNISLPEGLLTIDDGAFNGCTSLTEIEIPSTVTEIGVAAFNDCGRLGKIVFSGPAPEIQEAAFARVTANVYYPADDTTWTDEVKQNYDGTLTWKIDESTVKPNPELTYTITNGQVTITGYTGRDAEIVIPTKIDGYPVTTVGESAFQDCTSLTRVVLPEGLTTIDSAAFMGCSALSSIEIPETVTSIRGSSFSGCSSLESVTIPDGVTIIQGGTFAYCTTLESLTIPQSVKNIVDFAFNQSGLKEIYFEGNAPSFGTSIFYLVEATAYYPAGNATWTDEVRQNYGGTITWVEVEPPLDPGLIYEIIDDQVTIIGYTGNAIEVVIPEKIEGYPVTTIGAQAFMGCHSLQSIVIPAGVISIEEYAFYDCESLIEVTIPDSIDRIEQETFYGCVGLEHVTIPDGVNSIGIRAFSECRALESVTIPDSVNEIELGAFRYCQSLVSISVPKGVTVLPEDIFAYCESLQSVTLPVTLCGIAPGAFAYCRSLIEMTIPEGVTDIDVCAFYCCDGLKNIAIPANVDSIEERAFSGCGALKEIIFAGNAPALGMDVFASVTATAYYPTDNATWTDDVKQNYGGTITWVAYGDISGVAISGSVTSYSDDTATVTLELVNGDEEAVKTATVTGNSATYNFADVAAGTYTLRASKANHVTRSYEIVVGTADLTQDVILLPVGDITGDGKVTATDYSRLLAHVKKTGSIQDEYMLLSADVTGDGKITATDYSRLLAHVKKVSPLW